MRVALDGRTLQSRPAGGVGRALAGLVPGLAELIDLDLLLDSRLPEPDGALGLRLSEPAGPRLTVHRLRAPVGGGAAWLQWAAPRWLRGHRPDLFHCPFYGLPYRQPVPMVVTIYDLSFQDHPEWFSSRQRAAFSAQSNHAARSARTVFTGSEHVAGDIENHLDVDRSRIRVVPPRPSPGFLQALDRPGPSSPSGRVPYLVALGGATRRRLPVAVAAWAEARRMGAHCDLVVVGTEPPPGEHEGLRWAGAVTDQEWADLLRGAMAFLYPTVYEGFGLPALEAASAGTPVLAAPVGALPEVLGEAAVWIERPTSRPLAEAIVRLGTDSAQRARLSRMGLARASYWSQRSLGPSGSVAATFAGYRSALTTP